MIKPSKYGHDLHHGSCYGCGRDNKQGLQADFTYDEEKKEVFFTYTFREEFMGAPGYVHGGAISTLLDEAMGDFCFHIGYLVMTDEMRYKFIKATPIKKELQIRAWFIRKEHRKIFMECTLSSLDGSIVYVAGSASFHILPRKFFSRKVEGNKIGTLPHLEIQLETNFEKRGHIE